MFRWQLLLENLWNKNSVKNGNVVGISIFADDDDKSIALLINIQNNEKNCAKKFYQWHEMNKNGSCFSFVYWCKHIQMKWNGNVLAVDIKWKSDFLMPH